MTTTVGSQPNAGRASCLDEDAAVNLVGGAAGHEDEAPRPGLDAGGVEVGEPGGAAGGGVGRWRNVQAVQGGQQ
jgi:hypothetical protein